MPPQAVRKVGCRLPSFSPLPPSSAAEPGGTSNPLTTQSPRLGSIRADTGAVSQQDALAVQQSGTTSLSSSSSSGQLTSTDTDETMDTTPLSPMSEEAEPGTPLLQLPDTAGMLKPKDIEKTQCGEVSSPPDRRNLPIQSVHSKSRPLRSVDTLPGPRAPAVQTLGAGSSHPPPEQTTESGRIPRPRYVSLNQRGSSVPPLKPAATRGRPRIHHPATTQVESTRNSASMQPGSQGGAQHVSRKGSQQQHLTSDPYSFDDAVNQGDAVASGAHQKHLKQDRKPLCVASIVVCVFDDSRGRLY